MVGFVRDFRKRRTLFVAVGSSFLLFFYAKFVLGYVSRCFILDVGVKSLGLSFSYTTEMVQDFFKSRDRGQLFCYREFLKIWDIIFAFIYTLMYVSWSTYFFRNRPLLLLVPVLAMLADWAENYTETLMLNAYLKATPLSETLISLGSSINSVKLSLSMLAFLIILIGIMASVFRKFSIQSIFER